MVEPLSSTPGGVKRTHGYGRNLTKVVSIKRKATRLVDDLACKGVIREMVSGRDIKFKAPDNRKSQRDTGKLVAANRAIPSFHASYGI